MVRGVDTLTMPLVFSLAGGIDAAPDILVSYVVRVFGCDIDVAGSKQMSSFLGPDIGQR